MFSDNFQSCFNYTSSNSESFGLKYLRPYLRTTNWNLLLVYYNIKFSSTFFCASKPSLFISYVSWSIFFRCINALTTSCTYLTGCRYILIIYLHKSFSRENKGEWFGLMSLRCYLETLNLPRKVWQLQRWENFRL